MIRETSPILYTDREFYSILAQHFGRGESTLRVALTRWGKVEPRYVVTEKGFGRRKAWTEGDMLNAKKYLTELFSEAKKPFKQSK